MNESPVAPAVNWRDGPAARDPDAETLEIVAREMNLLRVQFVQGIPERLLRIEDAWCSAQHESADGQTLSNLYRLVHNLTGASATLNFAGLSATTRCLEHDLRALVAGAGPLTRDQRVQIDRGLLGLKRVALECAGPAVDGGASPSRNNQAPART